MSSVYDGNEDLYGASKCVDGVMMQPEPHNLCLSEMHVASPWLSISVPGYWNVVEVVVHSPNFCCADLLAPVRFSLKT